MASYWSGAIQGTNFYRWSGSTNASDCMAQGGYSTWAKGGSQAGRVYFSGLNNIDLNRYKITAVNLSMHFPSAGHDSKKWIQFYFSSWADSNYIATAFRTTAEAYNADISHSWYDEATLLNFEKSLKAGNCYLCCYNGETAGSSNYSTNYLKIDRIYISYNYEDRENLKLQYYKNEVWNYPSNAYYYNENKPQPAQEAPSFALTSNDGFRGYSCGATTYWGTGDEACQAFNKDYTSANAGWASTSNITEPQTIYLNLPKKGYLKSLVIYNRVWTSDTNIRGPYTINIKAKTNKDDDETWLITTATNLPGAISGRGTTIIIPEEYQNTLIESIHIEITDWHTKGTSGTHLCIGEIIPYIQYPTITVPPMALTSNAGTDGYSCGASSIFSTTEDAYEAFDFNLANGYSWGSIGDTTVSHSLWLNLPHHGKVQSVTITNRNYSLVNGPISIYIKGKKNINDTETIALSGLITDLPGSTILASTTIQIEEPYNQIEVQQIIVEVIDWDGKSSSYNVGIGEMSAEVIYPWHKIKKVLRYDPEPKAITVPPMAFGSNAGIMGYSCSATSVYDASIVDVYKAFDKDTTTNNNGWNSSPDVTDTQIIYLNLPKQGKVKSVTFYNRVYNVVRGPVTVEIKAKASLEDSESFNLTAQPITDLPGTVSGAQSIIEIEDGFNELLVQQIQLHITDWHTKGESGTHACVGEISAEVVYPTVTVPPVALTSNSGANGYSCEASSIYSNSFPAYFAFDKIKGTTNIWASLSTDTKPTLYLSLPKMGCVKNITLTNRDYTAYGTRGPISVLIKGKQDLLNPKEILLCSVPFTGLPGDTDGAITTLTIEENYNNIPVQQIIVEVLEWGSNSSEYCVIADMSAEVTYPWE